MANACKAFDRAARFAAGLAGTLMRGVALSGASIGGAVLISYGLGEIYRPLMFIAAGGFLLLLDRKQATERAGR